MSKTTVVSKSTLLANNSLFLTGANAQQYEIKYNPKVTNFKHVVSEALTQTLGNPFPFIRKNGNTHYRKFNIEGLIAAPETFSIEEEMEKEKEYRDTLIAFLYDGQPKVFSSFTEGEMIVRLMNVSLTPVAQLGRKLYSFGAEVIEIAELTSDNLEKYGISAGGA